MLKPVRNSFRSRGPSSPSSALARSYPAEPGVAGLGSGKSSAWGSRASSTSTASCRAVSDNGADVSQWEAEGLGHPRVDHFPFNDVEPEPEGWIRLARRTPALSGQLKSVWQRSIGEGEGGGSGDPARHICHGVMQNAVDEVGRVLMGGGSDSLDTAALVDRHIDDDRSGLHELQVRPLDQMG